MSTLLDLASPELDKPGPQQSRPALMGCLEGALRTVSTQFSGKVLDRLDIGLDTRGHTGGFGPKSARPDTNPGGAACVGSVGVGLCARGFPAASSFELSAPFQVV